MLGEVPAHTLWVKNPNTKGIKQFVKGDETKQSHRVVTYSTGKCEIEKKCQAQGALKLQNKVSSLKA